MVSTFSEDKAVLRENLKKLEQLLHIMQVIALCIFISTLTIGFGLAS